MGTISVITVNYNHSHVTEELLASIEATHANVPMQLIVVDNGSATDPVPEWRIKYPDVLFIRSNTNLGFSGGNNLGIKEATGDYLFFVNNDTEFTPGLVQLLSTTLDLYPKVGIVSPKIRYHDQPQMLQYAGYTLMSRYTTRNKCIGQFEQDNGQYDRVTGPTGFAHGAAMMVRREAISPELQMPECFFLYYEEMDWCEQVRRKGFEIWVNMQALIYHKESVSVGRQSTLKEYFMTRNRILFTRRNSNVLQLCVFCIYFATLVIPRNLLGYIKAGQWQFVQVFFKAIIWNFTHGSNSKELGYPVK